LSRWGKDARASTEYRDTQRWLYGQLIAAGYPAERIAQLYGGQDQDERERVKQEFQESPDLSPVRILLGTDAASEGINLQAHCHRVLPWEIPWNPNRLEQRNGRVDRHGQKADQVDVFHFVPEGWQGFDPAHDHQTDSGYEDGALEDELYFLAVAARKTERIREDLGSAGEVIAAQGKMEEVDGWLAEATEELPADAVLTELTGLWPQLEERLARALNTRANRRFRSLETLLAERCEQEVEGMRAILEDLGRSIRDRLDDTGHWQQESLFDIDDERRQLRADREGLLERLRRLPEVTETETAALRRRWADPSPRWFPVAVTFLVPRSLSLTAATTGTTANQEHR
jgi:superfamily II DNA/RNA helicase